MKELGGRKKNGAKKIKRSEQGNIGCEKDSRTGQREREHLNIHKITMDQYSGQMLQMLLDNSECLHNLFFSIR